MESIYNKTMTELEDYFLAKGDKKYRAVQVFEWLYQKKVSTFEEMSNLKKEVIASLQADFTTSTISIGKVERDQDVSKYLFYLQDGEKIEAVLMNHHYGNSLCISTQVGCNMGCKFCESGRLKKVRNLETSEMVEQILKVEQEEQLRISHVVVMGIGEPFDNYDHLVKFIEIINHPKGLALGSRHITVSTCGIIPKIKEFSNLPYQVNLAISLHAPNDEIRNRIMPINKVYTINELMKTLKDYVKKTNRRVTFEYILLKGINDREKDAIELAHLVKDLTCYVNLIPYNETNNLAFKRSDYETITKFYDILKKNKVNATIRKEFGSNISAACGQLRSKKED
ncbi:MAG TPA: 23S rRNA (adenine(2503)-C(2))-methyltransferase RlmN [Candidatus Scybalousia intestinigallinarum]|nr:23S rRNA (adenine(2503)-C(2))-methyltransferase RlmN [Candidatus Scybalousia intestinigallinarum]